MNKKQFKAEICVLENGNIYVNTYWRNHLVYHKYLIGNTKLTKKERDDLLNKLIQEMINSEDYNSKQWKIKALKRPSKEWLNTFHEVESK